MVRGRGERAEARRPVTGHAAADTTSSLEGRSHRAPVRRRRDLESAKVRRTPGGEGGGTSTHGTVPWWVVVSPRGRAGRAGRVGLPESLSSYTSILFSFSCCRWGVPLSLSLSRFTTLWPASGKGASQPTVWLAAGDPPRRPPSRTFPKSIFHMEISGTGPGTGRQGINTQTNMAPRRGD